MTDEELVEKLNENAGTNWTEEAKSQFLRLCELNPDEVPELRTRLIEGRIHGQGYWNTSFDCGCLVGTLYFTKPNVPVEERTAKVRPSSALMRAFLLRDDASDQARSDQARRDATYYIESFFMNIFFGDTPATNPASQLVLRWLDEWIAAKGQS